MQLPGHQSHLSLHFLDDPVRGEVGRSNHGGISGMDTGFLDVLQYAADVDILTIAQKVDIQLNGIIDEFIDQEGIF